MTTIQATGPIEICIHQGEVIISSLKGPIVRILDARQVVIAYPDHGNAEIYGDLSRPTSN